MSAFWRGWLNVWCWLVAVFGLVLAGGGLDATDGAAEMLFGVIGNGAAFEWTPHLRFSVALMGAVTMGWGLTFLATSHGVFRVNGCQIGIGYLATSGRSPRPELVRRTWPQDQINLTSGRCVAAANQYPAFDGC